MIWVMATLATFPMVSSTMDEEMANVHAIPNVPTIAGTDPSGGAGISQRCNAVAVWQSIPRR